MEAIASRLEAIASRLEAIASRLEAIASRLEASAGRWEAIASRLEASAGRREAIATIKYRFVLFVFGVLSFPVVRSQPPELASRKKVLKDEEDCVFLTTS